jgi:GDPmannose 4,6-dehydratase
MLKAGSSEMFGQAEKLPINEATPIAPRTPYATSKASAFWTVRNNRSMYNIFAVTAIFFNHEHPRRGKHNLALFFTRTDMYQSAELK